MLVMRIKFYLIVIILFVSLDYCYNQQRSRCERDVCSLEVTVHADNQTVDALE